MEKITEGNKNEDGEVFFKIPLTRIYKNSGEPTTPSVDCWGPDSFGNTRKPFICEPIETHEWEAFEQQGMGLRHAVSDCKRHILSNTWAFGRYTRGRSQEDESTTPIHRAPYRFFRLAGPPFKDRNLFFTQVNMLKWCLCVHTFVNAACCLS